MATRQCRARRPDGTPCPNPAVDNSPYCTFHQPERLQQETKEFTEQFTRELLRQGAFSLMRRRLSDMAFGIVLLAATGLAVGLLLQGFYTTEVPLANVLIYGCGLKLPMVLLGVLLLRKRSVIGLVIPLFYMPMDLLGIVYYQQTQSMTPALEAYYRLYWEINTALLIGGVSLMFALGGYLLGKRLGR